MYWFKGQIVYKFKSGCIAFYFNIKTHFGMVIIAICLHMVLIVTVNLFYYLKNLKFNFTMHKTISKYIIVHIYIHVLLLFQYFWINSMYIVHARCIHFVSWFILKTLNYLNVAYIFIRQILLWSCNVRLYLRNILGDKIWIV